MLRTLAGRLALLLWAALAARPTAAAAGPVPLPDSTAAASIVGSMIPDPGWYAKDFAFVYARGQYHLFYIRHQMGVPDDSTEVDFGHAIWSPARGWVQLAPVLHVRADKWDNLHVWAPSILYDDSTATWFMFYTGVTRVPFAYNWYQRIGVATSQDLSHWTRYDEPVFGGDMATGVFADSSQYAGCQFRDPYVMPDPDSGGRNWLMFYAATPQGPTSQLITHVARNARGLTPWASVRPLWNTDFFLAGPQAHYVGFTESPHVFPWGGQWYLFYSSNSSHRINFEYAPSPTADSTAWSSQNRLFNVMLQDTTTDHWYASEYLAVGSHQYFAYVNDLDDGIDIREMFWTGPTTFQFSQPEVAGVPGAGAPPAGPGLVVEGSVAAASALALRVTLSAAMDARVAVYDVTGRARRTLHAGPLRAGATRLDWDRRDDAGQRVGPGMYFVRLATAAGQRTARAVVLR